MNADHHAPVGGYLFSAPLAHLRLTLPLGFSNQTNVVVAVSQYVAPFVFEFDGGGGPVGASMVRTKYSPQPTWVQVVVE